MKIILSPAKKMNINTDSLKALNSPQFLQQTSEILQWLKGQSYNELKKIWACNADLAELNYKRIQEMNIRANDEFLINEEDLRTLTPAILAYEGIAYQYMAPAVFENKHFDYIQEHLRILSAFYGVLRPMDGVEAYRLEMQAKAKLGDYKNLYDFWGDRIYKAVRDESGIIINLASKEYSKCVEKYLYLKNLSGQANVDSINIKTKEKKLDKIIDKCASEGFDTYITITFCEKSGDKLVTKGTYAKMARGEMVRFMAENSIENPEDIKKFDRLGYRYRDDLSSDVEYVFERTESLL